MRSRIFERGRTPRRGTSALAALLLFAAVAGLVVLVFFVRDRAPGLPAPLASGSSVAPSRNTEPSSLPTPTRTSAAAERELPVARASAPLRIPAVLAGVVRRADGREVVGEWILEYRAQPSSTLPAGSALESRAFASTEFCIEGLTPGIYALRARNGRWSSRVVLAQATPTDASSSRPRTELVLEATGQLSGRIVDAAGEGVEGTRVVLYGTLPSEDIVATSDALGWFRFEDLNAGKYGIGVGDEGRPLFAKREITFEPPAMMLDPIRMPEHFDLDVRVTDADGNTVAGSRVWSQGATGSVFDLTTDATGVASAKAIVAGKYRVFAQGTGTAMANGVIKVGTTASAVLELKLATAQPR